MKYTLHLPDPQDHYLEIELLLDNAEIGPLELQFPVWRPGRYERGDFASMVRKWSAYDSEGNILTMHKKRKDLWVVQDTASRQVRICYDFYANTLNAGSTFASHSFWMLNPVNFLMYPPGAENDACELHLDVPEDWQMATSLKRSNGALVAESFHELVDSPIMMAAALDHWSYVVEGVDFHIWMYGDHKLDQSKTIEAFSAFSKNQISSFGSFPGESYHFLLMFHPERRYHGVEHLESTVIWLGPEDKIHENAVWEDLMGISSHELYHSWNVKTVRPSEMMPYDYSGEMYFRTGYVAEGVTTYMGDLHLIRSGVFDWTQFKKTQEKNLYRHLLNEAREIRSVAESSQELWLDGYGSDGAPGRISSIYAEGAIFSLMVDLSIRLRTKGTQGLLDLMRKLYSDSEVLEKGYTEERYLNECVEFGGQEVRKLIDKYIYRASDMIDDLEALLHKFGVVLKRSVPENVPMAQFGFRALKHAQGARITHVAEGSPARAAGLEIGMIIEKVNDEDLSRGLSECLNTGNESDIFHVSDALGSRKTEISRKEGSYFLEVILEADPEATIEQKKNFEIWTCAKH
jgi:predicted metalloprotease with PDZ domain